jgi:hypothetical protein
VKKDHDVVTIEFLIDDGNNIAQNRSSTNDEPALNVSSQMSAQNSGNKPGNKSQEKESS